ncbi:uncharacterized protein AB675_1809 [Cyphellophora attinorum]|uniref:Uncharacterized protein n=1 Tax=Cyphellophora attinorum TaxID=1664694 RepID=A0A0N0NPJ1_9EURO|nr:uncharacterized protein AB675_1809 [Phialophora attinorum]KPI42811.1 hypothetical protein AB675_1809 [Phialophora attinorum]
MDSMRSLNTSLPTPYSGRPVPPEHLLQAFRSAALSVTNLYKSAVQDQNNNRAAGYQDALDDILRFLDSENLGLQDGEGWRVRQWVTERYDGSANQPQPESEDERSESEPARTAATDNIVSSPEPQPVEQQEQQPQEQDAIMQRNEDTFEVNATAQPTIHPPEPSSFTFQYPSESAARLQVERERRESFSAPPQSSPVSDSDGPGNAPARPLTSSRGMRATQRGTSHRQNSNNRQSARGLGIASGSKRKNPFPDINFFDIGFGPRDGSDSGSKRGRYA